MLAALTKFNLPISASAPTTSQYSVTAARDGTAHITGTAVDVPTGALFGSAAPDSYDGFVATATHRQLLQQMLQDHTCGKDICIVGGKVGWAFV